MRALLLRPLDDLHDRHLGPFEQIFRRDAMVAVFVGSGEADSERALAQWPDCRVAHCRGRDGAGLGLLPERVPRPTRTVVRIAVERGKVRPQINDVSTIGGSMPSSEKDPLPRLQPALTMPGRGRFDVADLTLAVAEPNAVKPDRTARPSGVERIGWSFLHPARCPASHTTCATILDSGTRRRHLLPMVPPSCRSRDRTASPGGDSVGKGRETRCSAGAGPFFRDCEPARREPAPAGVSVPEPHRRLHSFGGRCGRCRGPPGSHMTAYLFGTSHTMPQ